MKLQVTKEDIWGKGGFFSKAEREEWVDYYTSPGPGRDQLKRLCKQALLHDSLQPDEDVAKARAGFGEMGRQLLLEAAVILALGGLDPRKVENKAILAAVEGVIGQATEGMLRGDSSGYDLLHRWTKGRPAMMEKWARKGADGKSRGAVEWVELTAENIRKSTKAKEFREARASGKLGRRFELEEGTVNPSVFAETEFAFTGDTANTALVPTVAANNTGSLKRWVVVFQEGSKGDGSGTNKDAKYVMRVKALSAFALVVAAVFAEFNLESVG
jgi:hypothetical protein